MRQGARFIDRARSRGVRSGPRWRLIYATSEKCGPIAHLLGHFICRYRLQPSRGMKSRRGISHSPIGDDIYVDARRALWRTSYNPPHLKGDVRDSRTTNIAEQNTIFSRRSASGVLRYETAARRLVFEEDSPLRCIREKFQNLRWSMPRSRSIRNLPFTPVSKESDQSRGTRVPTASS